MTELEALRCKDKECKKSESGKLALDSVMVEDLVRFQNWLWDENRVCLGVMVFWGQRNHGNGVTKNALI